MKKNKSLLWLILALIIIILISWLAKKEKPETQQEIQENKENIVLVEYSSDADELEILGVVYNNDEGTVSFLLNEDLGTIVLNSVVSASGARYANEDESIVLWEHQGELIITQDDIIIFNGHLSKIGEEEEGEEVVLNEFVDENLLGTWAWEKHVDENEEVTTPKKDLFTINFTDEKMVNGTTDCNNFFGPYQVDEGNILSFGDLATTMMYCEDSEEMLYTGLLAKAVSYEIDGNVLIINLDDNSKLYFQK